MVLVWILWIGGRKINSWILLQNYHTNFGLIDYIYTTTYITANRFPEQANQKIEAEKIGNGTELGAKMQTCKVELQGRTRKSKKFLFFDHLLTPSLHINP